MFKKLGKYFEILETGGQGALGLTIIGFMFTLISLIEFVVTYISGNSCIGLLYMTVGFMLFTIVFACGTYLCLKEVLECEKALTNNY